MWRAFKRSVRGWRTVLVGSAAAVLGILDALHAVDITPLLPEGRAGAVMAILGLAMIVLRLITTGPLGNALDPASEPQRERNN
jgi:hypothetical protein